MIGNKYNVAILDLSYILTRNLFACARGKKIGEFGAADVMKMTIQTLNKICRDFSITADKFCFFRDFWDRQLGGYYRTSLLKGLYKSDREYITEEKLAEMKKDPTKTPEEIEDAELKCYINKVKTEAKWGLIRDLGNFGVPCFGVEGWEYDDLAYLASCMLYGSGSKPNVIITKDSDLQYALTPNMEYFRIPTGGSDPEIITYDQMYYSLPEEVRKMGISLYQYKAISDSLGFGHNAMTRTAKKGIIETESIIKVLKGDYSDIEETEIFWKQYNSFDISKFPRLDEAQKLISDKLFKTGKLGKTEDFKMFCDKYGITGISDKYFNEFIGRFDAKLYSN